MHNEAAGGDKKRISSDDNIGSIWQWAAD